MVRESEGKGHREREEWKKGARDRHRGSEREMKRKKWMEEIERKRKKKLLMNLQSFHKPQFST